MRWLDGITDSMDVGLGGLWELMDREASRAVVHGVLKAGILKRFAIPFSSDIILPTKVRLVRAMVFPVVMYGCESWTTKKAEC